MLKPDIPAAEKRNNQRSLRYQLPDGNEGELVEKIVGKRTRKGKIQYRVKWVGQTKLTWEPEINLSTVRGLIKRIHLGEGARPSSTPRFLQVLPYLATAVVGAFGLQSIAKLAFGLDLADGYAAETAAKLDHAFDEAFVCVLHHLQKPEWLWKFQKWLNVGTERQFREHVEFIRSFVSTLVHESLAKRAKLGETQDATTMVELFIDAARDGDGEVSPTLLCDLAIMFVLAGRDTTTDALSWVLYNLSQHPEVEQRIRQELWEKVPDLMEGKTAALTLEQTPSLVYLEAAIKEAMRLFPAASLAPRQALSDAVLVDGTFIAKGTIVGISSYAMARLTSVWGDDAEQFCPDRFINEATGKLLVVPQSKFYGFGAGPKNCIGMTLAMFQMKTLVSAMLSRFRFAWEPNDGSYKFSATITLNHPLMASVHSMPVRQ